MSICERPVLAQALHHLRQAVQGLRSEHQIHEGRPRGDPLAFLAGHAAADADDHMGALLLEQPPFAQQREHLLLRLLAHRAGVHQQHVGLGRVVGAGHAIGIASSTSRILLESYSFIWQPKVFMYKRPAIGIVRQWAHAEKAAKILATMAIREVLKMGDPRLLAVAEPVQAFGTPELENLLADMRDTMRDLNGAGLALHRKSGWAPGWSFSAFEV
jgi:hypothetical protein